jgi:transcriptional regulator NrdR family protein
MLQKGAERALKRFSRDALFLSIHESCKHRTHSIEDATAITQTITGRLSEIATNGVVSRTELIRTVMDVLQNFDMTAAAVYRGLHPAD